MVLFSFWASHPKSFTKNLLHPAHEAHSHRGTGEKNTLTYSINKPYDYFSLSFIAHALTGLDDRSAFLTVMGLIFTGMDLVAVGNHKTLATLIEIQECGKIY